jgi:hypothetical protein
MKIKYFILPLFIFIQHTAYCQITVTLSICGSSTFNLFGTDSTGRNIYHDGSGSFAIQWNNDSISNGRWEIVQLPSSVGYSNNFASIPDPPCFGTGTWQTVTAGCGNVTDFTGNCQTTLMGVEDIGSQREISIFPNPAKDNFTISVLAELKMQNSEFHIYNMLGEKIYSEKLYGKTQTISYKSLSAGIYSVKITIGEKQYTHKLIIQ